MMRKGIRYKYSNSALLLSLLSCCVNRVLSQNCPMTIWVFDSLERCDNVNPPVALGELYADGTCRMVETSTSVFDSSYDLFPGNYRAVCTQDGKIRFVDSGCLSTTCDNREGSDSACDRDNTKPSSLYSRLNVPEYIVQQKSNASTSGFYTCLRLQGSDVSVTFVVFGDCNAEGCKVGDDLNPVPTAPVAAPPPPPTRSPTRFPTSSPTSAPTDGPTREPTNRPTRSPVEEPTTPYPTEEPTASPTEAPVPAPVSPPTLEPVSGPVSTPVAPPTTIPSKAVSETEHVKIKVSPMRTQLLDLALWEDATKRQIKELNTNTIYKIELTEITQTLLESRLVFDFEMTITSDGALSAIQMFRNAFLEESARASYLLKLVLNDPNFESVRLVEIERPDDDNKGTSANSSSSSSGPIIGGLVGALAVVAVVGGLFLLRKGRNKKGARDGAEKPTGNTEPTSHTPNNMPQWTHEILVDPSADDVSTLGGSLQGLNLTETAAGDEPTASVNLDYDFGKNRYRSDTTEDPSRSEAPTMFSHITKLGLLGDALFDDDNSLDQQYALTEVEETSSRLRPFEVRAPPGLLGMVVDTPNGGCPVVRALKPDSSLVKHVEIGDRLVSVDNQDVTKLSAFQVSNIISEKQNQTRVLVFVRFNKT